MTDIDNVVGCALAAFLTMGTLMFGVFFLALLIDLVSRLAS